MKVVYGLLTMDENWKVGLDFVCVFMTVADRLKSAF